MTGFILSKAARAFAVLFTTALFVFVVLRFSGDPAERMLGEFATPEAQAAFRTLWGLDKSIPEQFLIYLQHALQGDFGKSYADGRDVFDIIKQSIPKTLTVSVSAFVIAILLGIPAGIVAAIRRDSAVDRLVMGTAVLGHSIPMFLVGLIFIFIFAVWLRVLPSSGSSTWRHAILPIATFALYNAASIARFARATLIEILDQPYIAAARGDGIPPSEIILRHALPNAAIPLVTMLGILATSLLGGTVLVETVFAWTGMGAQFVRAVGQGDLNVVQAMILVFTVFVVTINLTVEILYALLNPKIRSQK